MNNEYTLEDTVRDKATWIEDNRSIDKNDPTLCIPPYQRDKIDYVLITRKEIKDRCAELAKQIFEDHKGK